VFLAQNDKPTVPIPGFETKTREDGSYSIALADLPAPISSDGKYLLNVVMPGYQSYAAAVAIGAYSSYIRNAVVLIEDKN
jgi:hypothetical protein